MRLKWIKRDTKEDVQDCMKKMGLSYAMLEYYCTVPEGGVVPKKYTEYVEYFKNYFRSRLRNPSKKQAELLAVGEAQFLEVSKDTLRLTLNPQDKFIWGGEPMTEQAKLEVLRDISSRLIHIRNLWNKVIIDVESDRDLNNVKKILQNKADGCKV